MKAKIGRFRIKIFLKVYEELGLINDELKILKSRNPDQIRNC